MNEVLIIGGNSSVGRSLLTVMLNDTDANFRITATYNKSSDNLPIHDRISWMNISSENSTAKLKALLNNDATYDHAIVLPGVILGIPLARYSDEEITSVIEVNTNFYIRLVRDLRLLVKPGGSIILMSSISAELGSFDEVYSASKSALNGLIKSCARKLENSVRINGIAPSLVEGSTMWSDMESGVRDRHYEKSPTGELVDLVNLSHIIVDLLKPHWRCLNGQVLQVNPGL